MIDVDSVGITLILLISEIPKSIMISSARGSAKAKEATDESLKWLPLTIDDLITESSKLEETLKTIGKKQRKPPNMHIVRWNAFEHRKR